MKRILDVPFVGWDGMRTYWWQWLLIGLILGSLVIGALYSLYSIIRILARKYKLRTPSDLIPSRVADRLKAVSARPLSLAVDHPRKKRPASFGVYLGEFNLPTTQSQARVLSQWDLIIVDPLQPGTVDAVLGLRDCQAVGRIDIGNTVTKKSSSINAIEEIEETVRTVFSGTVFTGILLAGWEGIFSPAILRALLRTFKELGLDVYLESCAPDFLKEVKALQNDSVSGLVIKNATIMRNGEKRDYFQMAKLQPTVKAFVSESCLRDFVVMAWETVDNPDTLTNAVVRRSIQWCNFYSALTWIGSEQALTDPALNFHTPEPLAAFGWLKEADVMKVHDIWRSNLDICHRAVGAETWDPLCDIFPALSPLLKSKASQEPRTKSEGIRLDAPPEWPSKIMSTGNPLRFSTSGLDYTSLGCFPLGSDASPMAFAEVVQTQIRLKRLGLLHPVAADKLKSVGMLLRQFCDDCLIPEGKYEQKVIAAVKELSNFAINDAVKVHLGLNSGFCKDNGTRFWAVYHHDYDGLNIYVSKDMQGLAGTITHAFLSCNGVFRDICFEIETELARWSGELTKTARLPRRILQDVTSLTPGEMLLFLQDMTLSDQKHGLSDDICACVKRQLLDAPTLDQLREQSTICYVDGRIESGELIESRLSWHREQGCECPESNVAINLFLDVEYVMTNLLKNRKEAELEVIATTMRNLLTSGGIDAYVDIFALSIFCTMRRAAFEEVYTEVTDRNPLFNNQSDQAAAFAESFAIGSRCEYYFDVTPSVLGKMLSDRFRRYYNEHQPPSWINGAPALATAYGGAQIDVNPDESVKPMPAYQQFTFLSVFAIPALIDIVLLTITGRGLYLSAFMSAPQKESATTALMVSLLLSGAIGTWIACGGAYYLVSMAFSAMNMFILSRLIAGLSFTIIGALAGLIGIAIVKGILNGLVFFLYLFALTAYLTLFAAIASFNFPGTGFLAGRKVIIMCIPFLFISPIITAFAGHDIIVYIAVLYAFIFLLAVGLRDVGAKWVTRFQTIRKTNDSEIKQWYLSKHANNDEKVFANLSDPAFMKLAREAFYDEVIAETKKSFMQRKTTDTMVAELASDWEATNFLIDWYCRYSDVPRPIPFSSSWNIQTKVSLDTFQNAQKGIRLHNAFIHWRQASGEVGCGVLYFVVALMDKWVELLTGSHFLGLAFDVDQGLRISAGFGLAYYLIGAVLVDTKAQSLHELGSKAQPVAIKFVSEIRISQKKDVRNRREVYWKTLFKFMMWHAWGLALTASIVWTLQDTREAVIMFCSYVLAYTGLLWYQYTKIFCGPHALKPLVIATICGLAVGIPLKLTAPKFLYSGVISLGVATWTAAILCLWTAKISMPKKVKSPVDLGVSFHSHTAPWSDPEWSQQELQSFHDNLASVPIEDRFLTDPQKHPGAEIKSVLQSHIENHHMKAAFPNLVNIVNWSIEAWEKGNLVVELVPTGSLGPGIRALTSHNEGSLKIWVESNPSPNHRIGVDESCHLIAETLVHSVAEALLQVPHEYAVLLESSFTLGISKNMQSYLTLETDTTLVSRWARRELLKQLCLGFESDTHWDKLPSSIRVILLSRCLGQACEVSDAQWHWLQARLCRFDTSDFDVHLARCNVGASNAMKVLEQTQFSTDESFPAIDNRDPETPDVIPHIPNSLLFVMKPLRYIHHVLGAAIKYSVIAMVADSQLQREFDYVISSQAAIIRVPAVFFISLIWMYGKFTQSVMLKLFIFHRRDDVKRLWEETKELAISWKRSRVTIRSTDGTFTGFKHPEQDGGFKLFQYLGKLQSEPEGNSLLCCISTYSRQTLLTVKEEYKNGNLVNEYRYEYKTNSKRGAKLSKEQRRRLPIMRRCVRGQNVQQNIFYNSAGLVESGSYMKDGNLIRFKYHYRKNSRFGDELLRAEFVLSHINCTVSWCAPPRHNPERIDRWIPHTKITEATFVQGPDVYESRWLYDHKFHPTIFTTLNGLRVQTPPMIQYDYLAVLRKPKHTSFIHDNPLYHCSSLKSSVISEWLGLNTQRFPVSTSASRSTLWKAWKDSAKFDGVIVQWLDEKLLRRDKVLQPYWRSRDRGNLESARKYLDRRGDAIMASADLDDDISSWTPLAVKISDLFNFGPGGDAVAHTRSREAGCDTATTLHVLAADNGTWPNEGGGVSACRRDMINSLRTVKWHMVCESAHDFGIPKHQTEQNIQSLKIIPLWGLDFLTPTHGLFKNRLDAEVHSVATADLDIQRNFIPTLTALVKGARAVTLSSADIKQATRALLNLNTYFQDSRHWGQVWTSDVVKEAWRELWLTEKIENSVPTSEWFDTELPTLGHLDTALDLWFRYLFIFSIPVPEKIPAVFQASHHSVSASYGIVCKIKRQCVLQIWDHAISWRETNLCLSSALCKLPPFVRNALLGLLRLTSVLILHHADIILPCADFFNPGWEVEIGTSQGTIEHRNSFKRKVDPVVNGITDMQKFAPVKEIKAEKPTVTMLSHVWYAKDIKTALLAADIIVNEWGFDDYHLDIYGAIDKAPTYSTECQELIASKGLRGKATLRGTADPIRVLENTWLFLNSSLSEGLPLALGEAALTGAPVVCTDVGASLRVLSDPDDFSRFSAVVAPNDARALARAQINLLAMLGEWSKYADDTEPAPALSSAPSPEEVAMVTQRMYTKSEQRRKLGMMTRAIVQKSFSGDRYLREHEQMLWVGKARKTISNSEEAATESADVPRTPIEEEVITIPPTAVYSWRSSTATGMSTYTPHSAIPVNLAADVSDSSVSMDSGASTEAESPMQRHFFDPKSLPVFSPRSSPASPGLSPYWSSRNKRAPLPSTRRSRGHTLSPSAGDSDIYRGLFREDIHPYRNSDVSSVMRDSFLSSREFIDNTAPSTRVPPILS